MTGGGSWAVLSNDFWSPETTEGVYEHRFDDPGTYRCHCDLQFLINGRVDVVASRAAAGWTD